MVTIFSFYSSLLIVSQYTGSVSAIILGIPGEATSLPAVKEGYPMQKYGFGDLAVKITAQYSFIGSLIALFLFYITLMYSMNFVKLYGNSIQLFFIFFCFVGPPGGGGGGGGWGWMGCVCVCARAHARTHVCVVK